MAKLSGAKKLICVTIVMILLSSPCMALAESPKTIKTGSGIVTELWEGKVLTATFRTGMCFTPNGIAKGVLILRHANGNEDTYHLNGTIKNNEFELSHLSGHVFNGQLTGPEEMVGTVKLANGLRLSLKGKRIKDAELIAEDCAPLKSSN